MVAFFVPPPPFVKTVSVTTTTWNPATVQAGITLSNGNLTATATVSASQSMVASIASHTSGKFYFEAKATDPSPGNENLSIGIAANPASTYAPQLLLFDDGLLGYWDGSTFTVESNSYPSYINNSVVGIAFDLTAHLIWFRVGAGSWNLGGTANPATGVGGFTIPSALNGVATFANGELVASGYAWLANFGGTAYANAAPAGFGNL